MKKRKILKIALIVIICLAVVGGVLIFCVNAYVKTIDGRNLI